MRIVEKKPCCNDSTIPIYRYRCSSMKETNKSVN